MIFVEDTRKAGSEEAEAERTHTPPAPHDIAVLAAAGK